MSEELDVSEELDRKVAEARGLLGECRRVILILKDAVPEGFIDCGGDKCRQLNCAACGGDFAEEYDTKAADAVLARIDAALKKGEG